MSKWEEIVKLRAKINVIEQKKLQIFNEMNSWFLEKISIVDNPLAKLAKKTERKSKLVK